MLTLNFLDNQREISSLGNQIAFLKPEELCYIRIQSIANLSVFEKKYIAKAVKISSNVFLSIPIDEFNLIKSNLEIQSWGLKGYALRSGYEVNKYLKHERRGSEFSGDLDLIEKIRLFQMECPKEKDIILEMQLSEDLRILAPTIARLYQNGMKWIIINIEGAPDKMRVQNFRDIFEYLKMRSCNYLNVYFAFWNPQFREWDIKTQNTFSGLAEVHIDISNRCTHNCVFCGLYGPLAMEDMKKNGGGELHSDVKSFMKMEIDSEKCFKIIESLPWSVDLIQFGGAGDPLMHKDAVKFISASRSRGFKVGVLSNMEYLDENDVKDLHLLGGRNPYDLHFIANVSAGSAEMYIQTRPKQTEKIYKKIVSNLALFSRLREEANQNGVFFTIMCVVTTINCTELLDVAKLAVQLKAQRLWFKPMEIHAQFQSPLIPQEDIMKNMAKSLKEAVTYAQNENIDIAQLDYCEKIFSQYLEGAIHV